LAALGLLPEGFPLRQKYIDLLGEQVAAFYDQHQHKLFMYEEASLENSQNRVVLAHELTHALQDQHFGLKRLPLESKTNDDMAAAAARLGRRSDHSDGAGPLKTSRSKRSRTTLASVTQNSRSQLASAPRYLREMLVFPTSAAGNLPLLPGAGAAGGLHRLSTSAGLLSAQILHPESSSAKLEEPIAK
jgi:hypothetical protein